MIALLFRLEIILWIEMGAQLGLWSGNDTTLDGDARVALTIRRSLRARQLILQVLPPRTVEVVVPKGMRPETVESFVHDHREWIERAGRELLESYPEPEFRPSMIELPAIEQSVRVAYFPSTDSRAHYRYDLGELRLYSTAEEFPDTAKLLRRWLLSQGRATLKPWLLRESKRTGLVPHGIQVRLQKTRWGSCSSSGNISLNAALLLIPPELVRYLFIHELCHLSHLSHSKHFWQAVAHHEPGFRQFDRRLADCWKHMPAWLSHAGSGSC